MQFCRVSHEHARAVRGEAAASITRVTDRLQTYVIIKTFRRYFERAPGWVILTTRGRKTGLPREVLLPCERFTGKLLHHHLDIRSMIKLDSQYRSRFDGRRHVRRVVPPCACRDHRRSGNQAFLQYRHIHISRRRGLSDQHDSRHPSAAGHDRIAALSGLRHRPLCSSGWCSPSASQVVSLQQRAAADHRSLGSPGTRTPNITFDPTAGSHSLAAAHHRWRSPHEGVEDDRVQARG